LSYVSIWKPVNDRIVKASVENPNEIIGLLIGRLDRNTLIIEDSITGEFSSEPHRVVLPPDTIAKIADDIVKGRLKGNIVGWYHSHTADGVFFSDTDVESQRILQQFSPLTVGMVVDSKTGDVGYFRLDSTGEPIKIPEDKVKVHVEKSEVAALKPSLPSRKLTKPTQLKPAAKLIIGALLITLICSLIFVGVVINKPLPQAFIHHIPVATAVIGSPVLITTNSTGVRNMTLFYASSASYASAEMKETAPNTYQYVIPESEVTGNLTYYLKGVTDAGGTVTTGMFHISVSDFSLSISNQTLFVYRNSTKPVSTDLNIIPINGFNEMVTVIPPGAPADVKVTVSSNQGRPGTIFRLSVTAGANANLGSFPLLVSATYAPNSSQPVIRTARLIVTVTDFDMEVSSSSLSVSAGAQAAFTLNVTLDYGFEAPITLTVVGLPQGAKITVIPTNDIILLNGPGSHSFVISEVGVRPGTYTITFIAVATPATGGSITHSSTIQVTVR